MITAGNITDYIAPFSPYLIQYNPPTASPTSITVAAMSATSGTLATTVYQKGDPIPNVNVGTSSPTEVGITGTVDVTVSNTPNVTISGTPTVDVNTGTVDISSGSITVNNPAGASGANVAPKWVNGISVVLGANSGISNLVGVIGNAQISFGNISAVSGATAATAIYIGDPTMQNIYWAYQLASGDSVAAPLEGLTQPGSNLAVNLTSGGTGQVRITIATA